MKINVHIPTVNALAQHLADIVYPKVLTDYSIALQNTKLQLEASIVHAIAVELEHVILANGYVCGEIPAESCVRLEHGFPWEGYCVDVDVVVGCYNHVAKGYDKLDAYGFNNVIAKSISDVSELNKANNKPSQTIPLNDNPETMKNR